LGILRGGDFWRCGMGSLRILTDEIRNETFAYRRDGNFWREVDPEELAGWNDEFDDHTPGYEEEEE
jgi:hypothetical protein